MSAQGKACCKKGGFEKGKCQKTAVVNAEDQNGTEATKADCPHERKKGEDPNECKKTDCPHEGKKCENPAECKKADKCGHSKKSGGWKFKFWEKSTHKGCCK